MIQQILLLFTESSPHHHPSFSSKDRLTRVDEMLSRKTQARDEYDRTIQETEAAYMKILESSQTLLHVLKRESTQLSKKKQPMV